VKFSEVRRSKLPPVRYLPPSEVGPSGISFPETLSAEHIRGEDPLQAVATCYRRASREFRDPTNFRFTAF
jgi:hypothetical protein